MSEKSELDETVADDKPAAETGRWSLPSYEVREVLGRGGMGEVLLARDRQIDREVAIKRVRGELSPELLARFLREAKIQARLDHPAIVPVHEVGTDERGNPYFTMKRLAGTTLAARLAAGGAIQPLLRAFVDVCFAIELAHTRGIVHRDLKPQNIMLGDYNDVYVIDWGVARELAETRASKPRMPGDSKPGETAAGTLLGTPGYMAPEQMRGDDVGTAADVYSLGSILFEILSGERLHPQEAAIASTLATPTASPATRRPERAIAPELDALCTQALAEDPAARPKARALAEAVQRYLDGDRDLERRRALAAEQLATAREALAAGPASRKLAAHAAGRALALDPESREAAQLVTQLILEPSAEQPPELVAALGESERALNRERSRRAYRAFLGIALYLPFVPLFDVQSYSQLALLVAACVAMSALSYANSRTGRVPVWVLMLGNFIVALAFSRLAGTFVLTPMLVCGQILTLTNSSWVDDRPWTVVAWVLVALFVPFGLEATGMIPTTWKIGSLGLITSSTITITHQVRDLWAIVLGEVALAIVVTRYALAMTRARRTAHREAFIQAWHLRQIVMP